MILPIFARRSKENLFGRELLRFRYGQVGLRDLPVAEYLHEDEPIASTLAVLMKLTEKRASSEALANLKIQALQNIANSNLTEGEQLFLISLVETYIPQARLPVRLRGVVMEALPDVELMWHEQIERDVRRSGMQKGLEEGRQQGLQQGLREMLLRLLTKKFGHPPQDWIDYIQDVDDPAVLNDISDQLLTAESLDEIILPKP